MAPERGPQTIATFITNPASVAVMNEQQPYERHLADKLQHLPPPAHVDESWEQMRLLLDKEMPRGGGMPGSRRWWVLGLAIGILFLATWLSGNYIKDKNEKGYVGAGSAGDPSVANTPVAGSHPEKSRGEPAAPPGLTAGTPAENTTAKNNNDHLKLPDEAIITPASKPGLTDKSNTVKSGTAQPDGSPLTAGNEKATATREKTTGYATAHIRRSHASKPENDKTILAAPKNGRTVKDKNRTVADGHSPQKGNNTAYSKPAEDRVHPSAVKAPLHYIDTKPAPALHPGPQIQKDYASQHGLLPQRPATNASAARKKVTKSREAGTVAVGFTLPLAFPLGSQRAMGYNFRAGHNTVSDYLPSPHLQYHFSGKTFLQTEAQLIAPQFINSILLYNDIVSTSSGYYTSHSIYAQKLYYFNLPVSIHHSPFPGFYMGTGLQFSSLISGVALTEERKWMPGGANMLTKQEYSRFRKDTLSDKIDGSEFRLLLDANYYWNKFTVGLRYNQALTNYISFRLSPGVPYSFDKNRALQFYLRYNLWEEKKKANNNKTLLTLK